LEEAGIYLDSSGRTLIEEAANATINNVLDLVDSFVNHSVGYMTEVLILFQGPVL
jgi:hypothetical protein